MKKRCISLLVLINLFNISNALAKSPTSFASLRMEVNKVSRKELMTTLRELVQSGKPSRFIGNIGHEKSHQYIVDQIKKYDVKSSGVLEVNEISPNVEVGKKLYQDDFNTKVKSVLPPTHPEFQKWASFTNYITNQLEIYKQYPVKNIVWEKKGINSKKTLVVVAHYDTVSHDKNTLQIKTQEEMPGADYNASGVTVALSLIKNLAANDYNYNIRVVFLDYQVLGFLGAYEEAQILKKRMDSGEEIFGVINLEMLGYDSKIFDKQKKNYNMKVYFRSSDKPDAKTDLGIALWMQELGSKFSSKIQFTPVNNNFSQSDQFRFWEVGIGAVCYSQDWEEDFNERNWQSPKDIPETINQDTLYEAYQFISGAVQAKLLDLTK